MTCVVLQVVPGDELGLVAKRRNVGIHRGTLMILLAFLDEVVDRPDGLAEAAMGNDDGEAVVLKCRMDGLFPEWLRPVRYRDPFLLRCHHRRHLLPRRALRRHLLRSPAGRGPCICRGTLP